MLPCQSSIESHAIFMPRLQAAIKVPVPLLLAQRYHFTLTVLHHVLQYRFLLKTQSTFLKLDPDRVTLAELALQHLFG